MNKSQQKRFEALYQQHLKALKRQGKAEATIDAYARAVRCVAEYFDNCPDRLTIEGLKDYLSSLVQSHSWSTVKLDWLINTLVLFLTSSYLYSYLTPLFTSTGKTSQQVRTVRIDICFSSIR